MRRIRLSKHARSDLEEIWNYIARDNPSAADRLIDRFWEKFLLLAEFPKSGRTCENISPPLRRIPSGNYVIFFRSIERGIEIVRVVHGARDIEQLLETDQI